MINKERKVQMGVSKNFIMRSSQMLGQESASFGVLRSGETLILESSTVHPVQQDAGEAGELGVQLGEHH